MNAKIVIIFIIVISGFSSIFAEDWNNTDNGSNVQGDTTKPMRNFQDPTKPQKALLLDGGYGLSGGSFAFGYRFWSLTASIGVAGLAVNVPPFSYNRPPGVTFDPSGDMPTGYSRTLVPGNAVFVDAGYYLSYLQTLNYFVIVGFYAQNNTFLAYETSSGSYYYVASAKTDGFTFGGGMELRMSDWIRMAVGYHTKRGVFLRLAYTWR
ncbi:MAG: hypothetical protein WCR42_05665 [bacterium]